MLGNSITLFSLQVFCSSETENEVTPLRGNLIRFGLPKRYLSQSIAKAKSPRHFGLLKRSIGEVVDQVVDHIGATKSNDSSRRDVKTCELF